ncbi:MAG: hypothetical protein QNJ54_11280 [Prochloraceae cyanobacterium]|nr:hypothetical protein [Prochloraceae cyanobacterium]
MLFTLSNVGALVPRNLAISYNSAMLSFHSMPHDEVFDIQINEKNIQW